MTNPYTLSSHGFSVGEEVEVRQQGYGREVFGRAVIKGFGPGPMFTNGETVAYFVGGSFICLGGDGIRKITAPAEP